MTILVTGATGFIGRHLAEHLLKRGDRVRVLVRDPARLSPTLADRVEVVTGDLTGGASLVEAVRDVESIFHLAGVTHALRPATYMDINAGGTARLLAAVQDVRPPLGRFLLVSSLAAAGPSPRGCPIDEDRTPAPTTPYGRSKLRAEELLVAAQVPGTIVRPPIVYGEGDEATLEFFKIARRRLFPTSAPLDREYSFIHAADLVRGIADAAFSPVTAARTYFLANHTTTTWNELIGTIHRVLGVSRVLRFTLSDGTLRLAAEFGEVAQAWFGVNLRINRSRVGEFLPKSWLCSPARAEQDFGFRAELTLEQGLRRAAEWYIEKGWI
jgi:nucleoside-diphosphate-sugar epimerase